MTEAALLRVLADDPHDILARMAYADWLEEQGDTRAALLRLQLALPTMPLGRPENTQGQDRLRELRRGFPENWLRVVEPLALLGDLPARTRSVLNRLRIPTLGELHSYTWVELLSGRSFGMASMDALRRALAALGLSLVDD